MTNIPEVLIPLIFKFGLKRWSDSAILIIPPNTSVMLREESPKGKGIINYYVKYGKPRIYNPSSGEIGDVIISDDVGVYRMSGQVKWHNIPLIESVYDEGYADFTITGENQYECTVLVYNYTSNYVIMDYTTYLFEFPIEHLEDIKKYFKGIADFFIKQAEEGE